MTTRDTGMRRGIDILFALRDAHARGDAGLGVTQVADVLDIDKSQVSRTLKVLAEYGLVDRDPSTRVYRVGWRVFELAQSAGDQHLIASAGPTLDRLLSTLNESVYVSVRAGGEAITVARREARHSIQASAQYWTLEATSVGRVLLGDLTRHDLRALFAQSPIRSARPGGVDSLDALCAEIERVAEQGFSVVVDEFEVGLTAIAAPIRDHHGAVIAALGVSGPTFRLADRTTETVDEVVAAARQIEDRLNAPHPSPGTGR